VRRIKPDAVVVDIMMPEVDGYEVCRRLKADPETAAIPVVFLTARTHIDKAQIGELGAAGVIIKPFETDTIAERILELCR
jgi:putative two-component system response regulator